MEGCRRFEQAASRGFKGEQLNACYTAVERYGAEGHGDQAVILREIIDLLTWFGYPKV